MILIWPAVMRVNFLIIHDKTRSFDLLLLGRYFVRHTDIVMLCLLGPVASIFARNVVELIEIFLLIVTCLYCDWSLWPSFGVKPIYMN